MMKEKIQQYWQKLKTAWSRRSRRQKGILIASVLVFITAVSLLIFFTTRTPLVPLYKDLTPAETGSIKEMLDARGIKSEIADGGTTIKVPKDQADALKVELAAEGLPKSGSIDYSFFSEKAGLGITDNEFNVIKLDAMQTELENLIKSIDGIRDAKVMINLPEKGIFVNDKEEEASASIVLQTEPGYNFDQKQIRALYTLVSKSVPNLPTDNIVIMDQNFNYLEMEDENSSNTAGFANQYAIKKEIEKDIQKQVQSMLSMLMGPGKAVVSVTADIDFTQEKREENLVEPVDKENMEGIAISAQRISESYTGNGAAAGGTPQAEDNTEPLGSTYLEGRNGEGEYEKTEETINYEVNRIRREIIESPYKIRDLGIQVIAEPPEGEGADPLEIEDSIRQILSTIVRTSIDKDTIDQPLTDDEISQKIAVTVQPLLGNPADEPQAESRIPLWAYIVGAALLIALIVLAVLYIRRRRREEEEEALAAAEDVNREEAPAEVPEIEGKESETSLRRKQIEKMAKEQPEEFAKLLRTWLSED